LGRRKLGYRYVEFPEADFGWWSLRRRELEVDGAGAECEVGVVEGVGVVGCVGELDGVEGGTDTVQLIVSVEGDFASAGDATLCSVMRTWWEVSCLEGPLAE